MYLALNIDEILRIIFSTLSRPDHYHLALTCKSFLEPALDELWNELQYPDRLFWLLSKDDCQELATEVDSTGHTGDVITHRPVSVQNWEHFDYYAKRVRRVRLLAEHYVSPEFQLYIQTRILERSTPLLPNLSSITFEDDSVTSDIAGALISASVREVHVPYSPLCDEEEMWRNKPFVQAITKILPSLSSLSLPGVDLNNEFSQALGGAIKLESIRLRKMEDWGTIKMLSSLPMLRKLINFRCELDGGVDQDTGDVGPWFPSLDDIWAMADILIPVLSRMNHRSVRNVHLIHESSSDDVLAAQQCIDFLGPSIHQPLSIRISKKSHSKPHQIPLSLVPLKHCVGLRQFYIRSFTSSEPTTEELVCLAAAWPKLSYLKIQCRRGIRLAVLKAFSDHCSKLKEIVVDLEEDQQVEEGFKCSELRHLETLDLGGKYQGPEHAGFMDTIRKQLRGSKAFRRRVL